MRKFILLFSLLIPSAINAKTIYVIEHAPSKDIARMYDGFSLQTVTDLMNQTGNTFDIVTKQQYEDSGLANIPTYSAAQLNAFQRTSAVGSLLNDGSPQAKLIRAVMLTILDANNANREWFTAFQGAVAASTSLADLKTRVAALPAMPDNTPAQMLNLIQNKINSGASD